MTCKKEEGNSPPSAKLVSFLDPPTRHFPTPQLQKHGNEEHAVPNKALYSQAQTWECYFHPSGEPVHLPLRHPFCLSSCRTRWNSHVN